ncbi:DUF423 domain-containing protein [Calycomorphotria hydatis]|uniref:DUF423 domain-containing protein n=1 Tax=Calycomorphotria hydatis TaxID=2528027 RepID=A0A517T6J7_9PLAN|nr:DUF423 domain-containing protein [Calycomorphotria hydatis]QDT64002.1 hypothetical protein V22_12320 [Calycomorphotria hydatis]
MTPKFWLISGAVFGGLGVVLGAFGAHGLEGWFLELYGNTPAKVVMGLEVPAAYKYLQDYKTGAEYQMIHALALLAVGLWGCWRGSSVSLNVAGVGFFVGILLFSGSLYALTLSGQRWWGAIAPIGGTALIVGWVALVVAVASTKPANSPE